MVREGKLAVRKGGEGKIVGRRGKGGGGCQVVGAIARRNIFSRLVTVFEQSFKIAKRCFVTKIGKI